MYLNLFTMLKSMLKKTVFSMTKEKKEIKSNMLRGVKRGKRREFQLGQRV